MLLCAGVRYHSLPSTTATTNCDKKETHKWSRKGKHLLRASRYTDHLQIAQLVPDFLLLCLATCSAAMREAAAHRRDLHGAELEMMEARQNQAQHPPDPAEDVDHATGII